MFKTVISVRGWIVNAFLEVQSGLGKRRKVQFADGFPLSPPFKIIAWIVYQVICFKRLFGFLGFKVIFVKCYTKLIYRK